MKKGFTMIELIFVIVILGILASVAIPRLSGTREDAEISTAIGNLRTLLSDAASYYAVKGNFSDAAGTGKANWRDFTNVPLHLAPTNSGDTLGAAIGDTTKAVDTAATPAATAFLAIGGANCIGLNIVEKVGDTPAYIQFTTNGAATGVCGQVIAKEPVRSFVNSTVPGVSGKKAMAIGSNTTIYK